MVAMLKTCSKCGQQKPLSDFHKHTTAKDGQGRPSARLQSVRQGTSEGEHQPRPVRVRQTQDSDLNSVRRVREAEVDLAPR
jgi:hypothetical protein